MFCSKCGKEFPDNALFCPSCGKSVGEKSVPTDMQEVKVMLDPSEVVDIKPAVDSGKSFAGQGRSLGLCLMIISVVGDLIAMFAIGFDSFIPITTGATVLFVIGFLLMMFCP